MNTISNNELLQHIKELIAEECSQQAISPDEITSDMSLKDDLGMTSLDTLGLMFKAEYSLNIDLVHDIDNCDYPLTVQDFYTQCANELEKQD